MGGATTATIPIGIVESAPFTVIPTPGTSDAVTMLIGTLPNLPSDHRGYTLAPFNLAPEFVEGPSTTRIVAEDIHTGGYIGTAVSATDPYNDPLTYTLSGADASSFAIDDTTGQLRTSIQLDYETRSTYTVTVNVTDGTLTSSITVTINVTDVEPEALNVGEPRTVRLFYLLPNDRPYRADVVESMKTGILEVQSFYSEQMAAHGYGNITFQIETDAQGAPIVHHVDGDYPESQYISRGFTEGEIGRSFDNSQNITLVVMDTSSTQVTGHGTGTKGNGWLILRGGWDWFVAGHEIGHAFGLQHDFRDDDYIVSYGRRGRSDAKLSACTAEFLAVNPYFNLNISPENVSPPTYKLISAKTYSAEAESIPIRVRVQDDAGLHQVILFVNTPNPFWGGTGEVVACRGLTGETDTVVEFNFDGILRSSPASSLSTTTQYTFYVIAVDQEGNRTGSGYDIDFNQGSERTAQVREAILGVVRLDDPSVSDYADITETHLAGITALYLNGRNITALKAGDFDGLTSLEELRLYNNQLSTLPDDIFSGLSSLQTLRFGLNSLTTLPDGLFDGLAALSDLRMYGNQLTTLPDGIFDGLTGLTTLSLGANAADPLLLTVSLEKVADGQFKAVAPAGAPFDIVLPISVTNGSVSGGATMLTIPAGSVESESLTVIRTPDTTYAVTVNIGTLPGLPSGHAGYTLVKSADLPITVTEGDIPATSVLTLTVGENPNDPFNDYPFGRIGYNKHPSPDWNFGTLSSPAFVIDGVSYTVIALYYMTHAKRLTLRTSPDLPRGFVLYLASQQFNSVDSGFIHRYSGDEWENVYLNWSVGQKVRVRVVETTPMLLGPPTNLQATTPNENVMLTWELPANSDPTTLPVNEYEVRISTDGGTTWLHGWRALIDSSPGEENRNSVTIGSNSADVYYILSNGTEYTFEVRALGGDGSGDAASVTLVLDRITPLSRRTPQVRDAIVAAVPGVNSANDVTEAHLGAITTLRVNAPPNQAVRPITFRIGDFSGLTTLTNLEMERWSGVSLPDGIFDGLNALERVSLYSSGLRSIPNSVLGLTSLKSLNIGYHGITTIPAGAFDQLTKLERLILDGGANTFTSLPDGVFDQLTSLTYLNLDQNNLTSLPDGVFDKLTSLKSLDLNRIYSLSSLPAGVFDKLTSLESLGLDGLRNDSLPAGIFDNLTSLTRLSMASSRLTSLPDGIFSGLSSLMSLNLSRSTPPLPLTVSLEKVADGQFKAIAPAGATFDFVLQISVANGTITGGATSIMIPKGSVESGTLTVIRTPGTTAAVTVDIRHPLPELPTSHQGYSLVRSDALPLEVISVVAVTTPDTTTQEAAVNIPDSNLRAKIETALSKASGAPISAAEMETLTSLTAQDASISNLIGLETATNLTTLKLGNNTVSDISALAGLTKLTELQLWDNSISDISHVASLTNLTRLYLWGNTISDISPVVGLTNLTRLYLGENSISNISAVTGLTNLIHLNLRENSVSDISAVAGLTNLTELRIGNNAITNIAAVANLTKLVWLDAPNNNISDISAVMNLTNLTTLTLTNNTITDIFPTARLTKLVEVFLNGNSITDISPLVSNTGLGEYTEIDVQGNPLSYPSIYTQIPALQAKNVYIDFDNRVATAPVKISGDTQQGNTGTVLAQPFVVEVQDANSVVFAGVPVTFAATAGGGRLSATSTTTDINGRTQSTLTLGNTAGTNTVRASVQGISQAATFTATATTTNTAPTFTAGSSTTRTIAENTAANVNIGTAITATDTDNDTLTYTLSGTDAAAFSIEPTTGQLKTKAPLDYETKNAYTVTVTASDGSLTDTINVTISVTDINELSTDAGICKVGDVLAPGESCTYPGTDTEFSVLNSGRGKFGFFTSGSSLNIKNTVINGKSYTLVAKNSIAALGK